MHAAEVADADAMEAAAARPDSASEVNQLCAVVDLAGLSQLLPQVVNLAGDDSLFHLVVASGLAGSMMRLLPLLNSVSLSYIMIARTTPSCRSPEDGQFEAARGAARRAMQLLSWTRRGGEFTDEEEPAIRAGIEATAPFRCADAVQMAAAMRASTWRRRRHAVLAHAVDLDSA